MHPHAQPGCLGDEELQGPENVSCSVQMALCKIEHTELINCHHNIVGKNSITFIKLKKIAFIAQITKVSFIN
jgi:hypothetical protein